MKYYRCQCGKREAWGSMPPPRCTGCPDCGTTLDTSPTAHTAPEPHHYVSTQVQTDEGPKPLTRCAWCTRTKAEIERPPA